MAYCTTFCCGDLDNPFCWASLWKHDWVYEYFEVLNFGKGKEFLYGIRV